MAKVHFWIQNGGGWTNACGSQRTHKLLSTTDRTKVTCEKCRAMFGCDRTKEQMKADEEYRQHLRQLHAAQDGLGDGRAILMQFHQPRDRRFDAHDFATCTPDGNGGTIWLCEIGHRLPENTVVIF